MLAAQIQNLPPAPTPPAPIEVVPKRRKRRSGGGWPEEPNDFYSAEDAELEAQVELDALINKVQQSIDVLADSLGVEVNHLDTEVVVKSSHVAVAAASTSRSSVDSTDDGDD